MKSKKNIVVIGGGTGIPVLLKELKNYSVDITAIVTVADDGGSSGIIRDYVDIVPPGDIRNCLVALSDLPQIYLDIFQHRFDSEDQFLSGHAIGNLVITALTEMKGNIFDAIDTLSNMMQIKGKVYAAASEPLVLHAVFEDGTIVSGESKIAQVGKKIKKVFITDTHHNLNGAKASKAVVSAIKNADMIVLGPGSLFTSILPNLMIPNLSQAILETKAHKVYICNIMTQRGETENLSDANHVEILHEHLQSQFIDTILVNTESIPIDYIAQQKDYLLPVKHHFKGLREAGCRVISDNFLLLKDGKFIYHNGKKVVNELINLLYRPMS